MSHEAKGKLIHILEKVSGTSKAGKEWSKQDFVIETEDQFPKKIAFTLFGDKADMLTPFKENEMIHVFFNLEANEYQGKWYSNVNAWKVDGIIEGGVNDTVPNNNAASGNPEEDNDLPFG
jgi:hypothetical protein